MFEKSFGRISLKFGEILERLQKNINEFCKSMRKYAGNFGKIVSRF